MKHKLKIINSAFEKLFYVFDSAWTNYADQLRVKCLEEEKEHRGFGPDFNWHHSADTVSASQCAKIFAVKRIAEYLGGHPAPTAKDYLHIQKSCFLAAGIVDEFGDKIRDAWKGFDLAELAGLDYGNFVKVKGGSHGS